MDSESDEVLAQVLAESRRMPSIYEAYHRAKLALDATPDGGGVMVPHTALAVLLEFVKHEYID
jgi:hypothetical protein